MPISGAPSNGPVGMTLKAWGIIYNQSAANGTNCLLRGSNVTSAVKNSNKYDLTFTSAMASTNYLVRATGNGSNSGLLPAPALSSILVGSCSIEAFDASGSKNTVGGFSFEVWE